MLINNIIWNVAFAFALAFIICYSYQFVYILIGLFHKPKEYTATKNHRFAILISARNEESVIRDLLNTIANQTYPTELLDTYVIADNCTDSTAEICRQCGATVYERFNKEKVGKGYALEVMFDNIYAEKGHDYYDGFFVFDADNLLEPNFVEEMNKTFSAGYKIITSYRNSKNYGSNWISAGYALWFLREAKYLNNSRSIIGTSGAISGTGFLVHKDIMNKTNGWKYFLLTEDLELTISNVIDGERVGYCHKAMLYDEQPETFATSWNQRLRWAKGFLQIFGKYGKTIIGGIFKSKGWRKKFSCYDLTATVFPMIFVTIFTFLLYVTLFIRAMIGGVSTGDYSEILRFAQSAMAGAIGGYLTLFIMGLITVITEWKTINTTNPKKIWYVFTFPIYMATWIPIGIVALFKKVEWKPIKHGVSTNIEDIKKNKK